MEIAIERMLDRLAPAGEQIITTTGSTGLSPLATGPCHGPTAPCLPPEGITLRRFRATDRGARGRCSLPFYQDKPVVAMVNVRAAASLGNPVHLATRPSKRSAPPGDRFSLP